jgi:serine-type D-Ala-D-Ala carboxypeptidase/endopeptidase (penicillin-binding protein 4)
LPRVARAGAGASSVRPSRPQHPARPRPAAPRPYRRLGGRALLFAALACVACALAPAVSQADAASVASRLAAITQHRHMQQAAVFVWDLQTGAALYAQNATTPLAPASNLKLVTSAAVLQTWGAAHRIATQVLAATAPSSDGVLRGDLYLRGLGDPSLSTLSYQREVLELKTTSVEGLARRLKALGLRRVRGAVVGDESYFDSRRVGVGWNPGEQDDCGRLSALSVDEALHNGNRLKDPPLQAARALTTALRHDGIKVDDAPGTGVTPPGAALLLQHESAPMSRLLRHMDKDSDNFFAETLVKGLGRDLYGVGSTDAGVQPGRQFLAQLDAPPGSYAVLDGSGLSYDDRLTADDLVRLLTAMYRRTDFPTFYNALAVAGRDGTLEYRMRNTPAQGNAHAKTGSLDIAASLSGYVTSADGHLLAFSMLCNAPHLDYWRTTGAYDAMVAALAASRPGGVTRLRDAPDTRQHVQGAADADFVADRALVPSPEVPAS